MKREYRIKDSEEFQTILNKRKFKNSKSFTIYTNKCASDHCRVGITVPKKLGNAVLRNKTKRQVRSMMQTIYQLDGPFDCIIMVRKGFFEQSYEDNRKDLEKLWNTVKM